MQFILAKSDFVVAYCPLKFYVLQPFFGCEANLFKQFLPFLLWGAQALVLSLHGVTLRLQYWQSLMKPNHFLLYVIVGQLLHTGECKIKQLIQLLLIRLLLLQLEMLLLLLQHLPTYWWNVIEKLFYFTSAFSYFFPTVCSFFLASFPYFMFSFPRVSAGLEKF